MPKNRARTNPLARAAMDELKMEIAEELGYFTHQPGRDRTKEYAEALERKKFEVADELGINLKNGYNGDLKSKEAGAIGGKLGGYIGGEMVRRMIRAAQEEMGKK